MFFGEIKHVFLWPNIIIYFLRLHILILVSLKSSNKMKSSLIYYSAISIFFFLSCTGSKEKRNMESDIITVNQERRDNISTKDLFSDIQVIPLETTPESLIRDITQIKFFEDRYYIHDYRRSQIFVFDRSEERRVGKECRSRWSPDH